MLFGFVRAWVGAAPAQGERVTNAALLAAPSSSTLDSPVPAGKGTCCKGREGTSQPPWCLYIALFLWEIEMHMMRDIHSVSTTAHSGKAEISSAKLSSPLFAHLPVPTLNAIIGSSSYAKAVCVRPSLVRNKTLNIATSCKSWPSKPYKSHAKEFN